MPVGVCRVRVADGAYGCMLLLMCIWMLVAVGVHGCLLVCGRWC